jgi:hypothetical protein
MSEQLDLLREVLPRLEAAAIPYMVSGSVAASFYAPPRMTRDIDVVVELQPADVDRFVGLFDSAFYLDVHDVRQAVQRRDMFNAIHLPTMGKLDFIVRKDEEYRRLELSRRRPMELGGARVWVTAPEDLILSKLHWARVSRSQLQLEPGRVVPRAVGRDPRRDRAPPGGARMKDTSDGVAALYRRLLMERSGVDRLRMASDMFTFARECALAGLRADGVTDPEELQVRLFLRLHGQQLSPEVRDRVAARIRAFVRAGEGADGVARDDG